MSDSKPLPLPPTRRSRLREAVALFLLALPGAARAEDLGSEAFHPRPLAGFALLEVRGGAQAIGGAGNPMFCVEIDTPWIIGFDGCGSGGGFLYPAPADAEEMVHFRFEGTIPVYTRGRTTTYVQPGIGIAEIERGSDQHGFLFGEAKSPDQREGAGPEAAVSAKMRAWPHPRFFVTGEVSAGVGYIPSAPVVLEQGSAWVPFAIGSVGVGF